MKNFLLSIGLLLSFFSKSQVNVTFQILNVPASHRTENIFLAGSFNTWSPSDKEYSFPAPLNGNTSLTVRLAKGFYEYKFTRGDWSKGETTQNGKDIGNRVARISQDTTITLSIAGWKDDFASVTMVKKHTASSQVHVIDTAFFIPQLNRTRRIWIYLPKDYSTNNKRFPVLYMHDGQNLFDEFTAGFGEWGIDEYLDSLSKNKSEVIVVGIDNGPKRMSEYNPFEFRNFGKGEGDQYVTFISTTLKSFVDKHYHTKPDRKNTFIAGSSMGGLISLYAVLKYPNVFRGAGIFSPAFWTAPKLDSVIKSSQFSNNPKLFFYAGGKESDEMIPDMQRIEKLIHLRNPATPVKEITDPAAQHNEAAWRKYFPQFYNWMFR